jgi:sulfite reductase alpha subunit-like flavoprotein
MIDGGERHVSYQSPLIIIVWICPETIPRKTTLRDLFTNHLDINAVPRRSFFRAIRHFAHDETEKEKLEEFCTPEGAVSISYFRPLSYDDAHSS